MNSYISKRWLESQWEEMQRSRATNVPFPLTADEIYDWHTLSVDEAVVTLMRLLREHIQ